MFLSKRRKEPHRVNMGLLEITSVPLIVAIVYFVLTLYKKYVAANKQKLIKIIPLIAAGLGMALGVLAFYAAPEIVVANNVLSAILIGGVSGLAATGTHQVLIQLGKSDDGKKNDDEDDKTQE